MNSLTQLPNIGKTLADKLNAVGINTLEELKEMGSENAIVKIATLENNGVCLNMLYALEGAIQGIRWHGLEQHKKQELKAFYNRLAKSI